MIPTTVNSHKTYFIQRIQDLMEYKNLSKMQVKAITGVNCKEIERILRYRKLDLNLDLLCLGELMRIEKKLYEAMVPANDSGRFKKYSLTDWIWRFGTKIQKNYWPMLEEGHWYVYDKIDMAGEIYHVQNWEEEIKETNIKRLKGYCHIPPWTPEMVEEHNEMIQQAIEKKKNDDHKFREYLQKPYQFKYPHAQRIETVFTTGYGFSHWQFSMQHYDKRTPYHYSFSHFSLRDWEKDLEDKKENFLACGIDEEDQQKLKKIIHQEIKEFQELYMYYKEEKYADEIDSLKFSLDLEKVSQDGKIAIAFKLFESLFIEYIGKARYYEGTDKPREGQAILCDLEELLLYLVDKVGERYAHIQIDDQSLRTHTNILARDIKGH